MIARAWGALKIVGFTLLFFFCFHVAKEIYVHCKG